MNISSLLAIAPLILALAVNDDVIQHPVVIGGKKGAGRKGAIQIPLAGSRRPPR